MKKIALPLLLLSVIMACSCGPEKSAHTAARESLPDSGEQGFSVPKGWLTSIRERGVPSGQTEEGFSVGKDTTQSHSGSASGTILSTSDDVGSFRSLTQGIRADAYRGKRIRLRGFLRSKDVNKSAGLWMRVDAIDRQQEEGFGENRPLGTTDWKPYSVVLDVPVDAAAIFFGVRMTGTGQIWIDDLGLEKVDPAAVSVTGGWLGPNYEDDPMEPQNMDFGLRLSSSPQFGVPGWSTSIEKWDDTIHLDPNQRHLGSPTVTLHLPAAGMRRLSLFQEIRAERYRGKRVRFQAYIKSTDKVRGGPSIAVPGGGQWIVSQVPELFEKNNQWVKDTREWKLISAVADIPRWANCIQLGVDLNSPGQMWVSHPSFKVVDPKKTPLTYSPPIPKIYSKENLSRLPTSPVNMDFEK